MNATERLSACLISVVWLSLTGCSLVYQISPASTTGRSDFTTNAPSQQPISASQTEKPATPPPPPPTPPPQHAQETRPPSAIATKGAEKLLISSTPAPPLTAPPRAAPPLTAPPHPIEKATVLVQPAPQEPPKTEQPARFAHTTVTELIVKGPPRQARPRRAGLQAFLLFVLVVCGAGLGVGGWVYLQRRAQPRHVPKSKYKRSAKLGEDDVKEPLDPREAAAFADKS